MRDRWEELLDLIQSGHDWRPEDMLKFVRLMGKEPIEAIDDYGLNAVFLAWDMLGQGEGRAFWERSREEAIAQGDRFAQWMKWREIARNVAPRSG